MEISQGCFYKNMPAGRYDSATGSRYTNVKPFGVRHLFRNFTESWSLAAMEMPRALGPMVTMEQLTEADRSPCSHTNAAGFSGKISLWKS